ncbi:MAG: DEAD/DEAH box helicase [Candidatus Pacearchaeota archaeon]|nr:DEAD/DEAH box helicase [Candidatus Pacearchaeota archaeon]
MVSLEHHVSKDLCSRELLGILIKQFKMEQFEKLGLSMNVLSSLKTMGFKKPTEIQEKTIPLALAGRDIVGQSATGSGKTLAFASPMIENLQQKNYVQALVLTPTRELAEQVANSIKSFSSKSLKILAVYGGVDINTQIRKLHNAEIIVGTPGRIIDHLKRGTLSLNKIKILVLDECDRMFDMGFHDDVEFIIHNCPIKRQTMLFSATVSQDIDCFIEKYTNNAIAVSVNSYVEDSKLKQIYYDVPDHLKFSLLVHLLKKENSKSAMVFCNTRRNADFIAENLNNLNINAIAIHGGLEQRKRIRIIEDFHKNRINILICTDVAARGLDIKGVSQIYNYDLPKDSKDYIHRIGRTARAGEEGEAISLLASRDYENFRRITENESLSIKSEKPPFVEQIRINIDYSRKRNFGRGGFSRVRRNDYKRKQNSKFEGRNSFGKRRDINKR